MNKRKMIEQVAHEITKKFSDEGKLVEAGFAAFHHLCLKNASPAQVDDMRLAYMAGAEHLFTSIMVIMEPGDEPTDADLKRMDLINAEITHWRAVLAEKMMPAQGKA